VQSLAWLGQWLSVSKANGIINDLTGRTAEIPGQAIQITEHMAGGAGKIAIPRSKIRIVKEGTPLLYNSGRRVISQSYRRDGFSRP
jgi:hypothetical protein